MARITAREGGLMEVTEALQLMRTIEAGYDGTPASADRIARLSRALVEAPDSFADLFWELNSADSIRHDAEELLRTTGEGATLAEGFAAIDQKYGRTKI